MTSASPTPPADASTAPARRGPLIAVLLLYALWLVGLGMLAFHTSNPPLLNLAQASRATLIVTATVEDLPTGRCRVAQTYSPGQPPETLFVTNLTRTRAVAGRTYLLPLIPDYAAEDDRYRVVEDSEHGLPPLIYPAGPEIEAQLLRWQQPRR